MPAAQAPARQPHPFQPQPWRDRRIEIILGNLLRTGVLISAAVVLAGACIYLYRHSHDPADYRVFRGEPSEYRTISGVIQSLISGRGQGIIQLGLLLLIATPIARVAFSVVGFAIERDRLYVAFTLLVLAILLYSFLGSGIGA
ncbi:MAG TPA: DUF1634 domain-containing protein [Bryobacteraceae bacterium]|nr:DUF1634 domain-containing protein [Bryobacteraceae bacterium]